MVIFSVIVASVVIGLCCADLGVFQLIRMLVKENKNQSHTCLFTSPLLQLNFAQLYQNIKGTIFKKVM